MRRKYRPITTLLLLALSTINGIEMVKAESKEKYPAPRYEVLSVLGKKIELRRYAPRIVAQVEVPGEEKAALDEGFRILAGYIFGKNNRRGVAMVKDPSAPRHEKIPMTAPVTSQAAQTPVLCNVGAADGASTLKVRFYMPPSYTLDTLPEPQDRRVHLIELPEEQYAAIRFSGSWNPSNFTKHANYLLNVLRQKNVIPSGCPICAYYDPPFTLPFLRHNEVLVPISRNSAVELSFTPLGAI